MAGKVILVLLALAIVPFAWSIGFGLGEVLGGILGTVVAFAALVAGVQLLRKQTKIDERKQNT